VALVLFSFLPKKYDYRPLQQLLCAATSPFHKKKISRFQFFSSYLFMMKRQALGEQRISGSI
jgi:hypothetical protein